MSSAPSPTIGRSVQLRPDNLGTTRANLSFRSPPTGIEYLDGAGQLTALREVYADVDHVAPRVLTALTEDSASLYLDRIAQVRLPTWSRGRVAVIGDAAYCTSPISGLGTSLGLIGAYLLAGELANYSHHADGFASYEKRMRPIVDEAQKLPPGIPRIVNPTSRLGVQVFRTAVRLCAKPMARAAAARLMPSSEETGRLPDYGEG